MSTHIGWSRKPRDGRAHLHLLELLSVRGDQGRHVIIGWHRYSRGELERLRGQGVRLRLSAVGIISFTNDVSPALFGDVFEEMRVVGTVRNRPYRRLVA